MRTARNIGHNALVSLTRADSYSSRSSPNCNNQKHATRKVSKFSASTQIYCPVQLGPTNTLGPVCVFAVHQNVEQDYTDTNIHHDVKLDYKLTRPLRR